MEWWAWWRFKVLSQYYSKPATPTTPDPPTTTTTTTPTSTTITTTTTTQADVTSYEPATDVDINTKSRTQTTSPTKTLVTSTKTSAFPYSGEEEGSISLPDISLQRNNIDMRILREKHPTFQHKKGLPQVAPSFAQIEFPERLVTSYGIPPPFFGKPRVSEYLSLS
ncbi:hypothetical protein KP79_PYT06691 [Mizuhopecten yessoensis]|uniref:Uncharacterized protein n=1 Tax=Mizuhopecten yessoensis TaxID=6573 RepID=A0A210QTF1_MIZYE|nr:hypothetical protein KP79_PYT06691 [Mizuhopecten yessoensis]